MHKADWNAEICEGGQFKPGGGIVYRYREVQKEKVRHDSRQPTPPKIDGGAEKIPLNNHLGTRFDSS